VGRRASHETAVTILACFWARKTWSQAELARECGVATRVVRKHVDELRECGWPFEIETDHPHVYFSLPQGWFPAGMALDAKNVAALLHVLLRVPPTPARALLLETALANVPRAAAGALARIIPPKTTAEDERWLPKLLDGLLEKRPLRLNYFTVSRGALGERVVSVQRVQVGPPVRFVAHCHSAGTLRWFRLDAIAELSLDSSPYVEIVDSVVDDFIDASVDGFHSSEPKTRVAFFVREPEARWVARNLPDGLRGTPEGSGLFVEAETAGLLPVARFVVGLGAAAECRTDELAAAVRALAAGALRGAGASPSGQGTAQ
jgi:predicted DNA-binding transcriptional regulator YafY